MPMLQKPLSLQKRIDTSKIHLGNDVCNLQIHAQGLFRSTLFDLSQDDAGSMLII